MKIAVITNTTIAGTNDAVRKLRDSAKRLGITILDTEKNAKPDFYLVLGGDGSVLRALHTVSDSNIPLVNINIGSLGYLTCAGLEALDAVLEALVKGNYGVCPRAMLQAECMNAEGESLTPVVHALNDMVALRCDSGRTIGINLNVDGTDVTEFLCDGLIVATPTGSTAYSLAAGGPIVLPQVPALTINVICPHTLTSRPLVLPESTKITLRISSGDTPVSFSFDGQVSTLLHAGDSIAICLSPRKANLVTLADYNPFTTLSHKLGWSGALRK